MFLEKINFKTGSSPRAWGTQLGSATVYLSQRFIPTCVGNTSYTLPTYGLASVHPHVRGEHTVMPRATAMYTGSSPRAWGTLDEEKIPGSTRRFIPTCVGNTKSGQMIVGILTVHPHVRGEHPPVAAIEAEISGSSPRAWGTRNIRHSCGPCRRFIPTCVGNTDHGSVRRWPQTVHPHVRGEHSGGKNILMQYHGSSPRAWGTRQEVGHKIFKARFIPTCVGNTF